MSEEQVIQDVGSVEPIDFRKEYFSLLKVMSQLGLQLQVTANNAEGKILEQESKSTNS